MLPLPIAVAVLLLVLVTVLLTLVAETLAVVHDWAVAFVALVLEFVACSQVADAAQTIAVAQLRQLQIADADVTKPNWLS